MDDIDIDGEEYDPLTLAAEALRRRRKVRGGVKRKTARGQGGTLPYELNRLLGDANVAYIDHRYEDALTACKGVIKQQPSHPDAYALMGLVHEEQGDHAKATDAYRLACASSTNDASLWRNFGISARAAGQMESAREAFARASKLDPSDVEAALEAASLYLAAGEKAKAMALHKRALESPRLTNPVPTLLGIVDVLHPLGDVEGVRDALTDCVNWCIGVLPDGDAEAGAGAGAGAGAAAPDVGVGAGAAPSDDEDKDESDDEDGDGQGGRGAKRTNPPQSRFRGLHVLQPRPNDAPSATNASNMLAELLMSRREYAAVSRLLERVHRYLRGVSGDAPFVPGAPATISSLADMLSSPSVLPLDLAVKYGIARLWLDDAETANVYFASLWAEEVSSVSDLNAEVALALSATGKRAAALSVFQRLRGVAIAEAAVGGGEGAAAAAAVDAPDAIAAGGAAGGALLAPTAPEPLNISNFSAWNPLPWLPTLPNGQNLGGTVKAGNTPAAIAARKVEVEAIIGHGPDLGLCSPSHVLPTPPMMHSVLCAIATCHEGGGGDGSDVGGGAAGDGAVAPHAPTHLSPRRVSAISACLLAAVRLLPEHFDTLQRCVTFLASHGRQREAAILLASPTVLHALPSEGDVGRALWVAHGLATAASVAVPNMRVDALTLLEASLGLMQPVETIYVRMQRLGVVISLCPGGLSGLARELQAAVNALLQDLNQPHRAVRLLSGVKLLVERAAVGDNAAARSVRSAEAAALAAVAAGTGAMEEEGGGTPLTFPESLLTLLEKASSAADAALGGETSQHGMAGIMDAPGAGRRGGSKRARPTPAAGAGGGGEERAPKAKKKRGAGVVAGKGGGVGDGGEGEEGVDEGMEEEEGVGEEGAAAVATKSAATAAAASARFANTGLAMRAAGRLRHLAERLHAVTRLIPGGEGGEGGAVVTVAAASAATVAGSLLPGPLGTSARSTERLDVILDRAAASSAAMAQATDGLSTALRRYAQGAPHDTAMWTIYRLVDSGANAATASAQALRTAVSRVKVAAGLPSDEAFHGGSLFMTQHGSGTSAFRRCIIRTHANHPTSVPLLMLAAGESMTSRSSWRYAVGAYSEVFRMLPREPLPVLGMAAAYLCAAGARTTKNRHTATLRAMSAFAHYAKLRHEQAAAGAAAGAGAGAAAALPSMSSTSLPMAAPHLPEWLARAETSYNLGRAAHQLGLPHLAVHSYRAALREGPPILPRGEGGEDADAPPPGSAAASIAPGGALDVRREAAYNLALLLKLSGDVAGALDVTQRFLSYD